MRLNSLSLSHPLRSLCLLLSLIDIVSSDVLLRLRFTDWSLHNTFTTPCNSTCTACLSCAGGTAELTLVTLIKEETVGRMGEHRSRHRTQPMNAQAATREHYWKWTALPKSDESQLKGDPSFVNPLTLNINNVKSVVVIYLELRGGSMLQSCQYTTSHSLRLRSLVTSPGTAAYELRGACYTLQVDVSALCAPFFYGPECVDRIPPGARTDGLNAGANGPMVPMSEARNYFNLFVLTGIILCLTIASMIFVGIGYSCMRLRRICDAKHERKLSATESVSTKTTTSERKKKSKKGVKNGDAANGGSKLLLHTTTDGFEEQNAGHMYTHAYGNQASLQPQHGYNGNFVGTVATGTTTGPMTDITHSSSSFSSNGAKSYQGGPNGTLVKGGIPLASVPPHMATIDDYEDCGRAGSTLGNRSLKDILVEQEEAQADYIGSGSGQYSGSEPNDYHDGNAPPKLTNYSYTGYY